VKPVSKTAYYCCGVRALDAAAPSSLCGDRYAERFMTLPGGRWIEVDEPGVIALKESRLPRGRTPPTRSPALR
jgi:O-methyltransferase involved in polyketide biosynthesis